jgi:hypothetical protein
MNQLSWVGQALLWGVALVCQGAAKEVSIDQRSIVETQSHTTSILFIFSDSKVIRPCNPFFDLGKDFFLSAIYII